LADLEADGAGEVDGEGRGGERAAGGRPRRADLGPRAAAVLRREQAERAAGVGAEAGVVQRDGAGAGGAIEPHGDAAAVADAPRLRAGLDIAAQGANQRVT